MTRPVCRCAALLVLFCCDSAKAITFDPEAPFTLDLGRGSRAYGLETISVAENGKVTFVRAGRNGLWETSAMQLTPEQVRDIAELMKRDGVLRLGRGYRKPSPGNAQWILMIRQGDEENEEGEEGFHADHYPSAKGRGAAGRMARQ